jgi:hypothetical protein
MSRMKTIAAKIYVRAKTIAAKIYVRANLFSDA